MTAFGPRAYGFTKATRGPTEALGRKMLATLVTDSVIVRNLRVPLLPWPG